MGGGLLERNLLDPLHESETLRSLKADVVHKRMDRGQAMVAGLDGVLPTDFQVIQKGQDGVCMEHVHRDRRRGTLLLVGQIPQQ